MNVYPKSEHRLAKGTVCMVRGEDADYLCVSGANPGFAGEMSNEAFLAPLTHENAEVLRAVVPALEKHDVTIALEPLTPTQTNFLTTAAEAVALARRVGSPRCRLHLDCKAMTSETTPIPELIHRHRDLLAHFHVNDPNARGPGFGKLDFVPILKALRQIDYRGWVSVEVFDYAPGAERLARESIKYLRACDGAN